MKDYITEIIKNKEPCLLDAGCGDGRLLGQFQHLFSRIVAVDPDPSRLKQAEQNAYREGYFEKVDFVSRKLEEFTSPYQFDVILCSHVLQHVNTASIPQILKNLSVSAKTGGLVFVLTCHSATGRDYYVRDYLAGLEFTEEEISRSGFDSIIDNDQKLLPVHFFSTDELSSLMMAEDLQVIGVRVFHSRNNLGFVNKLLQVDCLINALPFLKRKNGRDMLVVSIKSKSL
jgi:SAM-dependent methyltransferase